MTLTCCKFNMVIQKQPPPEVFLGKDVLKIYSKFTEEHLCQSVISIKLFCNFVEITLWHRCSPVNLLYIFRNTSGGLAPVSTVIWKCMDQCNFKLYRRYCKGKIKIKRLKKCNAPNYDVHVYIFNRLASFWHFILYIFLLGNKTLHLQFILNSILNPQGWWTQEVHWKVH